MAVALRIGSSTMRPFVWILLCWSLSSSILAEETEDPSTVLHSNGHGNDVSAADLLRAKKLVSLVDMAERTLRSHSEHHDALGHYSEWLNDMIERHSSLERLEAELNERTAKVDELIRQVNTLQLQQLTSRLNETVQQEIQELANTENEDTMEKEVDMGQFVSLRQLESALNPDVLLEESESKLDDWVQEVVREEVARYRATHASGACATPLDAARLVQSSLSDIAQVDLTSVLKGARVVYESTSSTYEPPPKAEQQMGNVPWRRLIPDDIERVLPSGWEDWNFGVPSSVRHTLGLAGAETLPPEAILDDNIYPGACWPMKGRKGQVTLRLKYPVKLESIGIEHASSLLVNDRSSAPKSVRVVGYPPCKDDDKSGCRGLGFDASQWRVLGTMSYNIQSPHSVQTFRLQADENDTAGGPDSCSEVASSCDDPDKSNANVLNRPNKAKTGEGHITAAVAIEILDNWGNEDYTCLYHLQLHGHLAT